MKKKLISLFLTFILIFSLTACGSDGTSSSSASGSAAQADDDTLNIAVSVDLTVIDPIQGYDTETNMALGSVVEGLFYFDKNSVVQPLIAESYEQKDTLTYVYQIRDDVTFSDGTQLTADDVVFSLERHRDADNASQLSWMFESVDTIEKTGDWEVTVTLKKADSMWQNTLATPASGIISQAYYEEHKDDFGTATGGIVGSGPYVITNWDSGTEVDMEENTNYWNKENTDLAFKKLAFKTMPDQSVVKMGLESGQVDFTMNISTDACKELESNDNVIVSATDYYGSTFVSLNTTVEPLNDINVRKAIAYAIDKESIVTTIVGEKYGEVAGSLPFTSLIGATQKEAYGDYFDTVEQYTYNLDTAKEYLAKSSAPDGFDVKLVYLAGNSVHEAVCLAIQQNLAELNINVTLEAAEYAEYLQDRYGGTKARNFDLFLTQWGSDYPDPAGTLLPMYYSSNNVAGGSNWTEYNNADFDALIDKQAAETDPEKRVQILEQAMDILADEIPNIPVYNHYKPFVVSSRVDYTFSPSLLYNIYFKDVKKAS